ncbi:MAG TPA: uL15 family ribosomal protein [Conexivisphaerales archaeon]|nr:uL15 family ribosomal protein [Conexivisphaerales archaeon]
MPTRQRKHRRMRGHRTVGYGQISQHRKHPGGRGHAGRHKFKWSWVTTYDPDYFGVHGFVNPTTIRTDTWIAVGDLDSLHAKLSGAGKVEEVDGMPHLDLLKLGIDKLLGSGDVASAYLVSVPRFTKQAKAKLEGVGGKIKEA